MKLALKPVLFVLLAGVVAVVVNVSCCSAPKVSELPGDEGRIRELGTPDGPGETPAAKAPDEAVVSAFVKLELDGVRGGRASVGLPGTVAQVKAMLLDYDNATGRRPWARAYRVLRRSDEEVEAEWTFKGKLGMNPTVRIGFRPAREGDDVVIAFKLTRKAFGVASYFGDYRLTPVPTKPPSVMLTQRVFIDSGISFANASHQDIENALRADAEAMFAWMKARLGGDG